ncbi:hypothetical protein BT96DRAFT_604889 [Gymnopus androsaceus JB14]|uniref:Uncharacterized protein n=1 Tax=Gymnopus androsaceus JB14 TaxID=1447944 RepID=A0A6A4HY86_9AGAR|nr:hypothetical protein BT96DRAFT_33698 [Gymnopus androsaceus JB14]KAE9401545.1 hypothetical protein BT96DRAFT_604889 [Gymnopus androsaceus JB14]
MDYELLLSRFLDEDSFDAQQVAAATKYQPGDTLVTPDDLDGWGDEFKSNSVYTRRGLAKSLTLIREIASCSLEQFEEAGTQPMSSKKRSTACFIVATFSVR